jgi:hypothetical protein
VTIDELAELLEQEQIEGRGGARVVVRGYEGGLDDVERAVDADVLLDRREESYYGAHIVVQVDGDARPFRGVPDEPLADERALWLIGSRDFVGGRIDPEGSVW